MTLLREMTNMKTSGPINFELDFVEDEITFEEFQRMAFNAGASRVKRVGDNFGSIQVKITVPSEKVGNAVIDAIYGEEDDSRDSNAFFMGLED